MLLRLVRKMLYRIGWALGDQHIVCTYPVSLTIDDSRAQSALASLGAGLAIVKRTWPRWFEARRQHVRGIVIRQVVEAMGQWHPDVSQVHLDYGYLSGTTATPTDVASTIVHEFTHARLHAAGIAYDHRDIRIERVCLRQEALFLKDLPPSDERAATLAANNARNENATHLWSLEVTEQRSRSAAAAFGIPRWLVNVMWRYRRGRRRAP